MSAPASAPALDDPFAPPPLEDPPVVPLPPQEIVVADSPNLFALQRDPKGVLYEDANIQIGWQEPQPFANRIGLIGIVYTNKSTQDLEQFEATIDSFAEASLKVAPTSDTLAVSAPQQQRVDIRIEQPFVTSPSLNVRFAAGGAPVSLRITVPIMTAKFVAGYNLTDAKQFAGVWAQGADSEQQKTITTNRPLEQTMIANLFKAFKMDICSGIDKPQNMVAGAQLVTATNRQWFLIRVECAPSKVQFRITGRATTGEFAEAMVSLVVSQLMSV